MSFPTFLGPLTWQMTCKINGFSRHKHYCLFPLVSLNLQMQQWLECACACSLSCYESHVCIVSCMGDVWLTLSGFPYLSDNVTLVSFQAAARWRMWRLARTSQSSRGWASGAPCTAVCIAAAAAGYAAACKGFIEQHGVGRWCDLYCRLGALPLQHGLFSL